MWLNVDCQEQKISILRRCRMSISLIMPAFNASETIDAALDSLLTQIRQPDEIIVVDDGSTDQTYADLQRRSADFKHLDFRIIRQDNSGDGSARNRGIREARGDWLTFLDADDVWYSNHLSQCLKLVKTYPQNHLFSMWFEVRDRNSQRRHIDTDTMLIHFPSLRKAFEEGDTVVLPPSSPGLLWACPIHINTACVRRSALNAIGAHFGHRPQGSDYMLWIWLFAHYGLVFRPVATSEYRFDKQKSSKRLAHAAADLIAHVEFLQARGVFDGVESQMGHAIARHLLSMTRAYGRSASGAQARFSAWNALKYAPLSAASFRALWIALKASLGSR